MKDRRFVCRLSQVQMFYLSIFLFIVTEEKEPIFEFGEFISLNLLVKVFKFKAQCPNQDPITTYEKGSTGKAASLYLTTTKYV